MSEPQNKAKKRIVWSPTCNRFVAYLDIMGFRDMVFRKTHKEILQSMQQFMVPIESLMKKPQDLFGKQDLSDNPNVVNVRPVIFSDSILLLSRDGSEESLADLLINTASIISQSLTKGIPIKGAIAYGEQTAYSEKSLFFGKPLIDAWDLQNEITIYGVVLHHTAEEFVVKKGLELGKNSIFIKYPVPLKQGPAVNHYLIDWLYSTNSSETEHIQDLYCGVSGNARRYVDNTIQFIDWTQKNKNNTVDNK